MKQPGGNVAVRQTLTKERKTEMLLKFMRIVYKQVKDEAGEMVKQRSDEVFYIRADEIIGICPGEEGTGLLLRDSGYLTVIATTETILSALKQCGIQTSVIDLMPTNETTAG
jgi:hypothetical protein